MWPFSRPPKPPVDWEERIVKLERANRVMTADWEEWYDKYRRLYARLNKRMQDAERVAPDVPQDERSDNGPRVGNPLAARLLNPYGRP